MTKNIKIMFIAGARPNFMKIAPIVKAMERRQQEGEGRDRNSRGQRPGVENG